MSIKLRRTTTVLLVLLSATAISWALGRGGASHDTRATGIAIIGVALFKVRVIVLEFMELRLASRPLKIGIDFWLVVLCSVLLAFYW